MSSTNSDTSVEAKLDTEVEEEIENISDDDDIQMTENQRKRKRYLHRHMPKQIQAMEGFFKGCPHPNKLQRTEIGQEIGMEPSQVKFWFQNKRTQMNPKHQNEEYTRLKIQTENLKAEHARYREALSKARCSNCGRMAMIGDMLIEERRLMLENARLLEEIECLTTMAANYLEKPFKGSTSKNGRGEEKDD